MNQDIYQQLFKNTETHYELQDRLEREVYQKDVKTASTAKTQPLDIFLTKFGAEEGTTNNFTSIDDMYQQHLDRKRDLNRLHT
ncbi:hypothetical protein MK852_23800 [Shewanella benthica]|uniref:hypothetical protein n=1 Tax=Shewanella benthica TaxID=43661 RepID=UPI00187ADFCD|nr:hypothetical protein [Shewanella benthica]MBE7216379.1 hypothetical protein [Shewanella benthica]MCL1065119.1 hypothetical protein [Shewanella benthica]